MNKNILSTVAMALIAVAAQAGNTVFSISGRVMDTSGKGVANVVVNDGQNFTTTDSRGQWTLTTDTCASKFVYISTPPAFELPQRDGLARFYIPVGEAVGRRNNDFTLRRRKTTSRSFTYLAISDPQVLDDRELARWREETAADLRHTADSLRGRGDIVAVTLGDLVFDTPDMFDGYANSCKRLGMTVFQTIGNHDFDKRYQDLHNARRGGQFAEHNYYRLFGPADYSFNIGGVHVVTMKNIDYMGDRKYTENITDAQLAWLERDLSYVPKGSVVFLNMHAAGWNSVMGEGNVRSAARLAKVLGGYRVHVFCGHTHFYQNVIVTDSIYQHNIGAACGAWWGGDVNQCGAPNGYLIVSVDGDDVRWHYKPTKAGTSVQMRLYAPGKFRRAKKYLVANVWDYDPRCRVEWSEDGAAKGSMEQFTSVDEAYIRQQNALYKDARDVRTPHLFRCVPSKGAKSVTVTFTNSFGEAYSETVRL